MQNVNYEAEDLNFDQRSACYFIQNQIKLECQIIFYFHKSELG